MKYLLSFAALLLVSTMPAHAQRASNSGGGSGGSIGGGTSRLPTYAPASFQAVYVTGADNYNFSPSTFRAYDQAVEEGRAALAERAKTLVDIAKENRATERTKAKLTIVQDASGNAVIETR
jgi:hypothetical protein